jgi:L-alanine-DL-glutamate epimerase-like enolase superfamily enzyme
VRLTRRPLELTLRETWTIARNSSTGKKNVLVRVEAEELEGLGEAAPNVRYGEDWQSVLAALDTVAPLVEAGGASHGEVIDAVAAVLPRAPAARAAIDIALHDLAARRAGVPVWRLLGADPRRMPVTSYSIGLDTLPAMQAKARAATGFAVLKVKVGRGDDRATLQAIRAVTDRPLTVDANEAWTDREQAVAMIDWMAGIGVTMVEQPLPASDLDGARWVHARSALPIVADEAVLAEADLEALPGAYDGVNIKLQKTGGLRAAGRMIDRARGLGLEVMIGCMIESSLGITAAAHLAPRCDHADLDGHLLLLGDPYRGVGFADGRLTLPDGPGLGVTAR